MLYHLIPVCETSPGTVKISQVLVPFSATVSGFCGFLGNPFPWSVEPVVRQKGRNAGTGWTRAGCGWEVPGRAWGGQRGVGGPWGVGGVVHLMGLNVGSKGDHMGHPGWLGTLMCRQRSSPLAVLKTAANAIPPACSLGSCTPVWPGSCDQGCPHSADEETKSYALRMWGGGAGPQAQPGWF